MGTLLANGALRVVVVDDYAEIRFLLSLQLEASATVQVVGEAATLSEALEVVAAQRPDVVLLDHRLGRRDSVSIISDLRRLGATVVVVTGQVTPALSRRAIEAGAFAVLDKQDIGQVLPGTLAALAA